MAGRPDSLKESAIGHCVFGRPANYSAAEDNIVRSNIRQVRLKLDEYYSGEGVRDAFRVSIPKGSYGVVLQEAPEATPANPATAHSRRHDVRLALLVFLATSALFLALFAIRRAAAPPRQESGPSLLSLLTPRPGRRLLVVVPDANVQLYQRLTGHTVTLQDYLAHRFAQADELRVVSPAFAKYADALFHSSVTQGFVLGLIPRFAQVTGPASLSVRTPDALAVKDFEGDNALLISGPFGDPWVQLFDSNLNFQIETGGDNRFAHVVNRRPAGQEKREYYNFTDSSRTTVCYARLAYLPGLAPGSRVLLAGGPHTASTEAASLYLTNPDSISQLCRLFHAKTPADLPWFELLIEARALGNSPWSMRIVAHRTVQIPSK